MKVQLNATPGTKVEVIKAPDGTITGVTFEPLFTNRHASTVVAYANSVNVRDEALDQTIFSASGANGRLSLLRRDESKVPLVDMTAEERNKLEKANETRRKSRGKEAQG